MSGESQRSAREDCDRDLRCARINPQRGFACWPPTLRWPPSSSLPRRSHVLLRHNMFAARTACRAFRPAVLRSNHHFHTSAAVAAKRTVSDLKIAGSNIEGYDSLDDECLDDDGSLDTSSAGHIRLQQQRRVLYYWRLIEHEMPNLVGGCISLVVGVRCD